MHNVNSVERCSFFLFGTVISVSPLLIGAVLPIVWQILALIIAVVLCLQRNTLFEISRPMRRFLVPAAILFALVLCWVLIQIFPWTPQFLHAGLWDEASTALDQPLQGSIAVDGSAALIYLLRLLLYASTFYLALVFASEPRRAEQCLKIVAISGGIYAAYGLLIYWTGNKYVLWFPKWAYQNDLTGPFVNRNHFATYLDLCLLALLCLIFQQFEKLDIRTASWRLQYAGFVEFMSRRILSIGGVFLLATALLLTHSRGGFLSLAAGTLALVIAIALSPSLRRVRYLYWTLVPFLMTTVAVVISGGITITRLFETDLQAEERLSVYRSVLDAIYDFWSRGSGLGSYGSVFPIYRTAAVPNYYDYAHNEYLQNILELGVPGAACLFAALGCLVAICIVGIRTRRRRGIFPCLGIAASVAVAVHSALDFSLEIPAVTLTYVYLLGIAVAQSVPSRKIEERKPL